MHRANDDKKPLEQRQVGDNIGSLLRGLIQKDMHRGHVLGKLGIMKSGKKFEAEVYCTTNECERNKPFSGKYQSQLYIRTNEGHGAALTSIIATCEHLVLFAASDEFLPENGEIKWRRVKTWTHLRRKFFDLYVDLHECMKLFEEGRDIS